PIPWRRLWAQARRRPGSGLRRSTSLSRLIGFWSRTSRPSSWPRSRAVSRASRSETIELVQASVSPRASMARRARPTRISRADRGVHPALEPLRGLGGEPERARPPPHPPRIEPRALEQEPGARLRDLGVGAAHHAGHRHGPVAVGDDQDLSGELAALAVQGGELLARPGAAHADCRAAQAIQVESVKRLAELEEDEVRDVDDVVDGALSHAL